MQDLRQKKCWASEAKHQNFKCPAQKFGGHKIPEKYIFTIRKIILNNFLTNKFFQALMLFQNTLFKDNFSIKIYYPPSSIILMFYCIFSCKYLIFCPKLPSKWTFLTPGKKTLAGIGEVNYDHLILVNG